MKDYTWETSKAMPTNSHSMDDFLDHHLFERFDIGAKIVLQKDSYAEVQDGDNKTYQVCASGNGDFFSHRVEFNLLD